MSRYINPVPQETIADGSAPNSSGTLTFYKSGTNVLLSVYADATFDTAITNPVPLDASGRTPNIFYEGAAKVQSKNSSGTLLWERDPVGGEQVTGELAFWESIVTYSLNSIVQGSDNKFYISLQAANINHDPTTPAPTWWSEIVFRGVYNSSESYSIGDVIQDSTGALWSSQTAANIGNTPSTDAGTNWLPAVTGAKIAEIITLEARTTTVLPKTGAVTLVALRINELQNAGPFTLPLASSVDANQIITIDFPDAYTAFEPVVNRAGSDTITSNAGTDTSITFKGSTRVTLTSDGVSDWSI